MASSCWQVLVDTGGTFTDCLARDPQGRVHRAKVLSSSTLRATVARVVRGDTLVLDQQWGVPDGFPVGWMLQPAGAGTESARRITAFDATRSLVGISDPFDVPPAAGTLVEIRSGLEAPVLAARLVTRTPADRPLPRLRMRLATTRGTNALLEGKGLPPVLFVTQGFPDLLEIGNQARPDLFALDIVKPASLHAAVVEVPERLAADGLVLRELDVEAIREQCLRHAAAGRRVAAVALMHSWRNPAHEEQLAAFLRACGFVHVSVSSAMGSAIRLLPRAQTAVANAYLAPVIEDYLTNVSKQIGTDSLESLHVMTSAGGLAGPLSFRPKDSLLSGPAGGVVGAAATGREAGAGRLVAFDMGGTSTDVSRHDGEPSYVFEHRVGAAHLVAPALAIETVAAGGGSICRFDGHRLLVGPESAGASPGPACYGAGGPLTITDVNLLLGRLDPARFEIPLREHEARARLDEVLAAMRDAGTPAVSAEQVLEGFLAIANERMAEAIRRISVRDGYDPGDYALVSFGGAGGQHACELAELLGMDRVVVPADASLLSAHGLGCAALERFAEQSVLRPLAEVAGELPGMLDRLVTQALDQLQAEGAAPEESVVRQRLVFLRLRGQEGALEVPWEQGTELQSLFAARYLDRYGYAPGEAALEVETVRVAVASGPVEPGQPADPDGHRREAPASGDRRVWWSGAWRQTPVHELSLLHSGEGASGPALLVDRHTSVFVPEGWGIRMETRGHCVLTRQANRRPSGIQSEATVGAAELELFTNRFKSIAAEMGEMLRRVAVSTNVKERLDYSCAVLDAEGGLVVNAPHVPVHLGALAHCVRAVAGRISLKPGDVAVTNHPGHGGSHLPDITVITPVFAGTELLGYTASRAHHAEIGGTRPGSAPPDATCLEQEGVLIEPMLLVDGGLGRWEKIGRVLTSGLWPSRSPADNLADLRAAVAANQAGARGLLGIASRHGVASTRAMMRALQDLVAAHMDEVLAALPEGVCEACERLDDGTPLHFRLARDGDGVLMDFTGTGGRHPGNLNATPAIVSAAAIYVLRLLAGGRFPELPLNSGILRRVRLRIPEGSILDPGFERAPLPAVIGGNVETSQRLVDTMLRALGLAACSQGTMNNVVFGNRAFGYYETLCGGAGATQNAPGADAVHTHMTNTRLTDPEVMEHRYPVRVEDFRIRRGSGGAGLHRGGDGITRRVRFLEPVSLSILTQHRVEAPYGLDGGEPGACGRQWAESRDGVRSDLGPVAACECAAGDLFVIETPGGGGWGARQ